MDLSEFISTTLLSIRTGLEIANKKFTVPFVMDQSDGKVDFDIAVEVANEKEKGKSGGLKIKVIEGKIDGKQTSRELNSSRIKLSVKVASRLQ